MFGFAEEFFSPQTLTGSVNINRVGQPSCLFSSPFGLNFGSFLQFINMLLKLLVD